MPVRSLLLAAALTCLLAPTVSAQTATGQAVYARDRVLDIRLIMAPIDWRQVRLSHPKSAAEASASSEGGYEQRPAELWIDGVRVGRVGVRKKGTFGSVVSTRPSLKIKLDEYVRGQAYAAVEDLTLNNNVQDQSMVQQFLAYDFFARAKVPAPRANFARVRVNDEDLGVYTNVEPIGRPFLRRVFGDDNGALYEAVAGDFDATRLTQIVEKRGGGVEGRRKLEQLRDVLAAEGPVTLSAIEALVDLDAFIRFWAAESLIGHWDGYSGNRNNYHLYLHPASGKLHFITWGADQVFIDPAGTQVALNPPKLFKANGLLARRLWELPEAQARYQAVMRELLAGPWDEPRMLADMNDRQRLLQPMSGLAPAIVAQVSERVRTFLARRRAEVLAEMAGPAPTWPSITAATTDVPYTLSGTFTAPWGPAVPGDPLAIGSASLKLQLNGQDAPPFDRAGAYAVTTAQPSARAGYPGVTITAVSGDRTWRILLTVDPMLFGVGTLPIDQFESRMVLQLIEGNRPARPRNTGNLGELRLEETRASEGGVLRGSFTLRGLAP